MSNSSALLPIWLGWTVAGAFALVGLSHASYLLRTAGQRRPWHACHVLLAVSMLCMFAPGLGADRPLATAWQTVLALTCLIAIAWTLIGSAGTPNPLWVLTVLDLAVMIWMWSARRPEAIIAWPVAVYLTATGVLWLVDLARQVDRGRQGLAQLLPLDRPDAQVVLRGWLSAPRPADTGLLGELDISSSMSFMAAAMAYMVVVMHLA